MCPDGYQRVSDGILAAVKTDHTIIVIAQHPESIVQNYDKQPKVKP
jgi:hypothetical protein